MFSAQSRTAVSYLWIVNVNTGARRQLTEHDGVQPSWSPHGLRIAFWAVGESNRVRDVWTISARGGTPVRVTDDAPADWNPIWAPDGAHLFFLSDRSGSMNLWRVAIDERSGKVLSALESVTVPAPNVAHLNMSADGSRLAFTSITSGSNIQRVAFDFDAGAIRGTPSPVTSGTREWTMVEPSPDGQWLAFVSGRPPEDLFVSRTDGSGVRQLTNDPAFDRLPRWAPDSSRIAFHSNRGGVQQIWTIRPDGTELTRLTDYPDSGLTHPAWSPDGTSMIGAAPSTHKLVLFDPRQPWNRQSPQELPLLDDGKAFFTQPAWAPDSHSLACVTFNERRAPSLTVPAGDLVIYTVDTRRYEKLPPAAQTVAWLSDSRRLLYTTPEGKTALFDLRTRTSHDVISVLLDQAVGARPSANNQELFFVRADVRR